MLISIKDNKILNTSKYSFFSHAGVDIWYSGLFFVRGLRAGEESLQYLAQETSANHAMDYRQFMGCFTVVIKINEEIIVFSDNSNMHGIFISDDFIGSNIYEMAEVMEQPTLNLKAVCEYLTFTRPYRTETLVSEIKKLGSDVFVKIHDDTFDIQKKNIGELGDKSIITEPDKFFGDIAYAVSEMKKVCALTGGVDSRLVTAFMGHFDSEKKVDCFISGDNEQAEEIVCAIQAAKNAGMPIEVISPKFDMTDGECYIEKIFDVGEYKALLNTSGYRIQYFMECLSHKYDLLLTGNAGDMHKGFWDTRMAPLYPRGKKPNMRKFIKKYFNLGKYEKYLGEALRKESAILNEETEKIFAGVKVKGDVYKSYLKGGWKDWEPYALRYTEVAQLIVYSPLQEYELVKYSYDISPKGKRMNAFHRKYVTRYNTKLAKAKTIQGLTCSINKVDLFCDFFRLVGFNIKRLYFVAERYFFKTHNHVVQSVNKNSIDLLIRNTDDSYKAYEWAQNRGYIDANYEYEDIPFELCFKLLYFYLFCKKVKI